jgi:hypothetical protein
VKRYIVDPDAQAELVEAVMRYEEEPGLRFRFAD